MPVNPLLASLGREKVENLNVMAHVAATAKELSRRTKKGPRYVREKWPEIEQKDESARVGCTC